MSDEIYGAATNGLGHLEDAAGGLVGDDTLQAKGKLHRAAGTLQGAYGKVKVEAGKAREKASVTYARAAAGAKDRVGEMESQIRDKPLASVGLVAAVGVLVGLILGGGLGALGARETHRRR